jgi:hypothetical protein
LRGQQYDYRVAAGCDHPTTAQLCRVLDDPNIEAARKYQKYPPLIFPDFTDYTNGTKNIAARAGILAKYTPATRLKLLEGNSGDTDAEIKTAKELQSKFDALNSQFENFSAAAANRFTHSQHIELSKKIVDGKIPDSVVLLSREAVHEDYRKKRAAIEVQLAPIVEQARQLAKPIILRANASLREIAAAFESSERLQAQQYEIIFVPSHLLRSCWSMIIGLNCDNIDRAGGLPSPRHLLAGIIAL